MDVQQEINTSLQQYKIKVYKRAIPNIIMMKMKTSEKD